VDGSLLGHGRDASGQYYRRNRYYDPSAGRFTQEDPIGLAGGINLYGFADGDPVTYVDPYGLFKCPGAPGCPKVSESGLDVIIARLGSIEIRSGGTRSWRNNNPGNLRPGAFTSRHGAIGQTNNGVTGSFAVFNDVETGERARGILITSGDYSTLSVMGMIAKYAPASDGNNVEAYQAYVRGQTGLSNERMGELSSGQLQSVLKAMRTHEGFREGTVTRRSTGACAREDACTPPPPE
jgi:RHS repeat-associated protein